MQPKAFMTEELFHRWVEDVFLPATEDLRTQGKIVLILDGHGSHCGLATSERCREAGVILLGLPAHSTHILQPFDVGLAAPLKQYYHKAKMLWRVTLGHDESHNVSKKQMIKLLACAQKGESKSAWDRAM